MFKIRVTDGKWPERIGGNEEATTENPTNQNLPTVTFTVRIAVIFPPAQILRRIFRSEKLMMRLRNHVAVTRLLLRRRHTKPKSKSFADVSLRPPSNQPPLAQVTSLMFG